MNHAYRLVWNGLLGAYVPAPEFARARGKSTEGKTLAAAAVLSAFAFNALALPTDGQIGAGQGSIASSGNAMTVTQTSQKMSVNWNSFNIAQGEKVTFQQPNRSAIALNRVLGNDASAIYGSLEANGQVFLLNPNGVLFAPSAQVNVGGLVASTLSLSDSDFLAGKYTFQGNGGSVTNQGTINAADGGYVALLGGLVSNEGTISAKLGTVALGAGNQATLDFAGDKLVSLQVDQGTLQALAQNKQLIQVEGGTVFMTAKAASALAKAVVNNEGVIEARTVENHSGTIVLIGDMANGTVQVSGTLDASAPNGGDGGFIETSAAQVKIADDVKINTAATQGQAGNWLIDPVDFTIAASGGNITGATLGTLLGANNVTIQTATGTDSATNRYGTAGSNGDIFVNDAVTWSANKLTLNAYRNININANLNGSGTASLALEYGQGAVAAGNTSAYSLNNGAKVNLPAGVNFSTKLGIDGATTAYTVIASLGAEGSTTASDLQGINGNLSGKYVLGADIDAAVTSSWNLGTGFMPIRSEVAAFTGTFDGLGHTITGLRIDRPSTDRVGLFGKTNSAVIRNVGLVGGSVTGNDYVGGLVGENAYSTVSNSYATGAVNGYYYVGGLVGHNYFYGTISNSHATGAINGSSRIGGLVGYNHYYSTVSNSYATGNVSGTSFLGGLVGSNSDNITVSNSYATGVVSGTTYVGGLVGENYNGPISNSYATGAVSGTTYVGGLAGYNAGTVSNSYWDTTTSGKTLGIGAGTNSGATGLTSLQMRTASNFAGFGFTSTPGATGNNWVIVDVDGTLNNANGTAGATRPMLASEYSKSIVNAHQLQLTAMDKTAAYTLGQNIDASATATSTNIWIGSTFIPVGSSSSPFTGTFDGLGHTITGLTINLPSNNAIGLFGFAGSSAVIRNVGLLGGSVAGGNEVGGLIGSNSGAVSNSYATGTVSGTSHVGGLIGYINNSTVSNSYATSTVSGTSDVGGLVGLSNSSTVSNSYATGTVNGTSSVGGLVGETFGAAISNSYATGTVSGTTNFVGGLVGYTGATSPVSNSYATGAASGSQYVGGLVGHNAGIGTFSNNYATGAVSGSQYVGGLMGYNSYSTVTNNYWDTNTSGRSIGIGGGNVTGATGLNSTAMQAQSSFSGWNFSTTWIMYEGHTNPLLRSFMTPLTVTVNNASKTYDAQAYAGSKSVAYSLANPNVSGALVYGGAASSAVNAGTYAISASGLYSDQQGYAISYVDGTLTINKAPLTISAAPITKTYDGSTLISSSCATGPCTGGIRTGIVTSGMLFGGAYLAGGTFAFTDPNAGTNKTVTISGVAINGDSANNYSITYANSTVGTIEKAALTVTANNASKTYDAQAYAGGNGVGYTGFVNGETAAVLGGALAYGGTSQGAKNAGSYSINLSGLTAGNYEIAYQNGTLTINPAQLTVSTSPVTKTYDGTTSANGSAIITFGSLKGSDSLSGGSFAFTDPNAGSNKTVGVSGVTLNDGNGGNNYAVTYANNTASTIDKAALTVSANNASKTYDAQAYSGGNGVAYTGFVNGETASVLGGALAYGGTSQGAKNAGSYSINLSGLTAGNYEIAYQNGTLTITPAQLTVSTSPVTKTYDGTTAAKGSAIVTVGSLKGSDSLSGGTFAFTDPNAGSSKTVTVSGVTLNDGNGGNNYNVAYANNMASTIDKAPLTVTASNAAKTYDALAYSGGNGADYTGFVNGETAAVLGGALAYGGTSQGAKNTGSYSIDLSGLTAGNYEIAYQNGTLTITPAQLTVSTSPVTKTYDGTTAANGSAIVTAGSLKGSDTLSGGTFAFTDPNAGSSKTVTVSGVTLNDGNGGNNYNVAYANNMASTIDKAPLTVTANNASKTYDALAYSGGNGVAYTGFVNNETAAVLGGALAYGGTAQGAKNAGSYSINLSGLTAGNYEIAYQNGTLTIIPAQLTVSTSPVTKTYDGTTAANGSAIVTVGSLKGSDSLSGGTFAFTNPNAGSSKTVTVSGVAINDGNGGNNYNVTYASNTASTIDKAPLTVTASNVAKTYDAQAYSGGNGAGYTGFVNGETAAVLGGTLAYGGDAQGAKNAGSYRIDLSGLTAGNYEIAYQDGTLTITPAQLTVSTSPVTKTYDGTTAANGSAIVTVGSLKGSDTLSGGTFAFTDPNAGSSKTVTVSGVTLNDGNGGNNYDVAYANDTASTIEKAPLTVIANNASKTYDAQAYSGGNGVGYTGFVNGETAAVLGGALAYGGDSQGAKNAGSYSINLSGLTAGNYEIAYQDGTLTITPAQLTVSTSPVTKTYDGTTAANGSAIVTAGSLKGSDSLSGGSFAFTDPNAGSSKTVTVSGVALNDGNGGNNYAVTYANNTASTIEKAPLTVTASNAAKTYDAQAYSGGNGVGYTGFVNGETAAVLGGALAYGGTSQGAKNAGSYSIDLSGLTAGNYEIAYQDGTLTITPAQLTVSTSPVTKTYDGTTAANGSAIVTAGSLKGSDTLSGGTFAFTDPSAGSNKTVTVSGVAISDGNEGRNYSLTFQSNLTSTINPAPIAAAVAPELSNSYQSAVASTARSTAPSTGAQQRSATIPTLAAETAVSKNVDSGPTNAASAQATTDQGPSNHEAVQQTIMPVQVRQEPVIADLVATGILRVVSSGISLPELVGGDSPSGDPAGR